MKNIIILIVLLIGFSVYSQNVVGVQCVETKNSAKYGCKWQIFNDSTATATVKFVKVYYQCGGKMYEFPRSTVVKGNGKVSLEYKKNKCDSPKEKSYREFKIISVKFNK